MADFFVLNTIHHVPSCGVTACQWGSNGLQQHRDAFDLGTTPFSALKRHDLFASKGGALMQWLKLTAWKSEIAEVSPPLCHSSFKGTKCFFPTHS